MTPFEDHFSELASAYAAYRPQYPAALFEWLASLCRAHERAWDCACGSGQATRSLAGLFAQVIATDASGTQIAAAPAHTRVRYRVATAEASGIAPASVDLIAVAQALHWFDLERFYREARRVARPATVLAAWSYGTLRVDEPKIDERVQQFYGDTLGPYWPPQRRHVDSGYRTLAFPAPELAAPAFDMRAHWSLSQLLGMLQSWSAVGRYRKARGEDPLPDLARALSSLWGAPAREREIVWPLTVRATRLVPD